MAIRDLRPGAGEIFITGIALKGSGIPVTRPLERRRGAYICPTGKRGAGWVHPGLRVAPFGARIMPIGANPMLFLGLR